MAAPEAARRSSTDASTLREAMRQVARACIFGVDIDPSSIEATRVRLSELVGEDLSAAGGSWLRAADALTLDWKSELPIFDAVIANPPYIRQESLAGEAIKKSDLRRWRVYDGVADLYVYFFELAHQLLGPGGRYAVVAPNKWMTAAYGQPLRIFLAHQKSVEAIVDLSEMSVFEDADAFPCVIYGTVGTPRDREITAIVAASTDTFEAVAAATDPRRPASLLIARERLGEGPWHLDSREDAALLARLYKEYAPLSEIIGTRWSRGVVTGCNDAFVIDRPTRDALLAADPRRGGSSAELATEQLIRPFVKGRDIRAYRVAEISRWILLIDRGTPLEALPPGVRAHLERWKERLLPRPDDADPRTWSGRKPGTYAWHELQDPVVPLAKSHAPRMLYQDIQTAPLCALDDEGALVPDTTVWILPSQDPVLLAILCSPLYRWIAQRRFPPALNGAVRPKLQYMQQLPVPRVPPALQREIAGRVEQRRAEPSDAKRLEAELAQLVADAYELSHRERALVEASVPTTPLAV